MKLFAAASTLDIDGWIRGLLSAAISGGASAVTGGLGVSGMDPSHYNFQAGKFYILVCTLFAANAVVSMAKFLQSTPLPTVKIVTTTVEVTEQGKAPPRTVTTIEEKKVVPVDAPPPTT